MAETNAAMKSRIKNDIAQLHDAMQADPNNGAALVSKFMQDHSQDKKEIQKEAFKNFEFPEGIVLVQTNFAGWNLSNSRWNNANCTNANFNNATLDKSVFTSANLREAQFHKASLKDCKWIKTNLRSVKYQKSQATNCVFQQCDIKHANFEGSDLTSSRLTTCQCNGSNFIDANLTGTSFLESDIRSCTFNGAIMVKAHFNPSHVDAKTRLEDLMDVRGMVMPKLVHQSLGPDYGGLSLTQLREITIEYDLARLQASFSGFKSILHMSALVIFLFPYCWFIIKQWGVATFSPFEGETISLWIAILRFIVNGGDGWQVGWSPNWFSCLAFLSALLYNSSRLGLLFKTKQLELQERITGLPVDFRLNQKKRKSWWWWHHVFLYAYVIGVIYNTTHFLTMQVHV